MKIAITGASGFVGSRLAIALKESGHNPCAFVRESSDISILERNGIAFHRIDLLDPSTLLVSYLSKIDAIVHCAGGGRIRNNSDYWVQNYSTTANVMDWVASSSVQHVVFLSSLSAAGSGEKLTESMKAQPHSLYGKAKREAEKKVLSHSPSLTVSILRAPSIYGAGDTRFLPFFQSVKKGWCPIPPNKTLSMIHIDDCISALLLLLKSKASGCFYIEDGTVWTWRFLGEQIQRALQEKGHHKRLWNLPIPSFAIYAQGLLNEWRAAIWKSNTLITRDKWRDGREAHWVCCSQKIRSELGWASKKTPEEGIESTVLWYLEKGWL
jgi:nucleoside-diphosphate-sugar epimerase